MRRLNFLSLLLLVVLVGRTSGDEPTANASQKDARSAEQRRASASPRNYRPEQGPPCHCVQELWLDYPGPNDLYVCLTFISAPCQQGEEELWYGLPYGQLPQSCVLQACESYQGGFVSEESLPGHGMHLSASGARDTVLRGLKNAKLTNPSLHWVEPPQYHRIPEEMIPSELEIDHEILVIALPITINDPDSKLHGKTFHLCLQINSAEDITAAEFSKGERRRGRQFAIDYRVETEDRRGIVWLK
ncbi:MAG: hypothetical protein L0228_03685 [Planctomycetes bacterium]|nr:hypothetical protein [Planctomycetota bacterium]